MTRTALILGASGKIGSHAATAFTAAGWTVRLFNRKTDDMTQAAMGADVIVNGLNPAGYKDWETLVPAYTAQVIAAAKASGASVIIPGNIYNFGDQPGTFDENTPQLATTRKGRVRIAMERSYRAAGVRTIILRAGNFIDPHGNGDFMSMIALRAIRSGKLTAIGTPDAVQAYAYVPDWARAAVALASLDDLPSFVDVPFPGHAMTTLQMKAAFERLLGKPLKLAQFPWWLMTFAAPVWTLAYEMKEMRYLYSMPHQISGTRFHALLPDFKATPLKEVLRNSLPADLHPNKAMRASGQNLLA